jgi:hypothetical protein
VAFTAIAEKGRPEQEEGTSIAMVALLSNPFLTKWLWLASRDIEGLSRWRCDAFALCPLLPPFAARVTSLRARLLLKERRHFHQGGFLEFIAKFRLLQLPLDSVGTSLLHL